MIVTSTQLDNGTLSLVFKGRKAMLQFITARHVSLSLGKALITGVIKQSPP